MRLGSTQSATFMAGIFGKPVSGSAVFVTSTGQLGTQPSSARYKRDIQDMGERSQQLHQLRPVIFRYKQDPQGVRQYGLIAEEVARVYPELVVRGADGTVEGVQYQELIPLLLNELQHQAQTLAMQAQTLAIQTQQLSVQAQELSTLKAQNAQLQEAVAQQTETLRVRLAHLEGRAHVATLASR